MMTQSLPMSGGLPEPQQSEEQPTFEQALEQIREIVSRLESGTLSLEASIRTYQDGSRLIEQCRRMIADAELRISQLSGLDDTQDPRGGDDA